MRSVMNHNFSQVPRAEIQRSSFDRSHGLKTTFDEGWLIPIYADEVLPGDTFKLSTSMFARMSTPIKPLMDNLFLDYFFFAVPIRLIWDNWQKFNGEQNNPGDSTDFLTPIIKMPNYAAGGVTTGSLSDYLGIPVGPLGVNNTGIEVCSFWHRAYNLIWNEWFRDQNLQDSVVVDKDDGPDNYSDYVLKRRGKRHDYFTSCLPWPQKGPDVMLPIGETAPLKGRATFPVGYQNGNQTGVTVADLTAQYDSLIMPQGLTDWQSGGGTAGVGGRIGVPFFDAEDNTWGTRTYENTIYADLSEATAATINDIRLAFQVQKMYERDARGGTRYTEIIRSHFGVISPDARLQRPEYLGGGSCAVNMHPVAQTTANEDTPTRNDTQGNLAAYATASAVGGGFVKSFTEHCVILGLASVRADLTYQQGINRMYLRRTREDFYWPVFASLGEQEVLNKEIYAIGEESDEDVFGYQERYAEYRYKPSMITGLFRSIPSSGVETLDVWHASQVFLGLPTLSETFIEENPPISRLVAVTDQHHFMADFYFKLHCVRPMPTYGVPGYVDHF